jgi:hypothetical protein
MGHGRPVDPGVADTKVCLEAHRQALANLVVSLSVGVMLYFMW